MPFSSPCFCSLERVPSDCSSRVRHSEYKIGPDDVLGVTLFGQDPNTLAT